MAHHRPFDSHDDQDGDSGEHKTQRRQEREGDAHPIDLIAVQHRRQSRETMEQTGVGGDEDAQRVDSGALGIELAAWRVGGRVAETQDLLSVGQLERGRTEPVGAVGRRLRRRRRRGEHAEKAAFAKARAGRQDRAIADEAAASDPIDADLKPPPNMRRPRGVHQQPPDRVRVNQRIRLCSFLDGSN